MGQKIVQLDMFKDEKENFEELTAKSFRALFASMHARNKALDTVVAYMSEMQEVVMRMNDRLNRLAEK
jgi:hypothetical protein